MSEIKSARRARFTCTKCGNTEIVTGGNKRFLCKECIPTRFGSETYKYRAHAAVHTAISKGIMKPASDFCCADCGKPAIEYDHRDYRKPLEVDPVCRSCNLRRGPGIPPDGHIDWAISHGLVPYRLKKRVHQLFTSLGKPTDVLEGLPDLLDLSHWGEIWPRSAASEINDAA